MDLQIEPWRHLYVMLGTSSAALLGLLYVVASQHLDEIVENASYRTRVYCNSLYRIITLVEAACMLTPQRVTYLGLELVTANLVGAAVNIKNTYKFTLNPELRRRGGFSYMRMTNFIGAFVFGISAGACLMQSLSLGLVLAVVPYVALMVGVALNAWTIMLGIGRSDIAANAAASKPGQRRQRRNS
jgi:hypothetical protein